MTRDDIKKIEEIKKMAMAIEDNRPGQESFISAIDDCLQGNIHFGLSIAVAGKASPKINPPAGCDKIAFTLINAVCLYTENIDKNMSPNAAMDRALKVLEL